MKLMCKEIQNRGLRYREWATSVELYILAKKVIADITFKTI